MKEHLLLVLISIPVSLLFPSHTGGLWPILNLKQFICYKQSLLLRYILPDMHSNLFDVVIMLSPWISRMLINIFLLLSIITLFYNLFGKICQISGMFYFLGWPQPFGFSWTPLNLYCSFAIIKVFCIAICLDDILVLVCSKWADKSTHSFLYSLVVCLGLHINFSMCDLCLTQTFCF